MKFLLGQVFLNRNDTKEDILLGVDDIVLHLKAMNVWIMRIKTIVALGASLSYLNLVNPAHIEVDASTTS